MAARRQYWLLKSEPTVFAFADLWAAPRRESPWDGVRNYQARNFLRAMRVGDLAFFYHSNAAPACIAGVVEIVREAYADPTQFDPGHDQFDPRSKPAEPSWSAVDIRAVEPLTRSVSLEELRGAPELASFPLLQRGSRLSVLPVREAEWRAILALGRRKVES